MFWLSWTHPVGPTCPAAVLDAWNKRKSSFLVWAHVCFKYGFVFGLHIYSMQKTQNLIWSKSVYELLLFFSPLKSIQHILFFLGAQAIA